MGRVRTWTGAVAVAAALCVSGCGDDALPAQIALALEHVLENPPRSWTKSHLGEVRRFYEIRGGAPAWIDDGRSGRAFDAVRLLRTAADHGLDPANYDEAGLAALADDLSRPDTTDDARLSRPLRLAQLDLRVTSGLLMFGRDLAAGRLQPQAVERRWKSQRQARDVAASLAEATAGDPPDLTAWLERLRPVHPEYAALQRALAALRGQRDKGGWPKVQRGDTASLTARLAAAGHTQADLAEALRAFQTLHGIKASGIADADTVAAMNVPIDERIRQVAINLERWRWMPDDLGERHLFVNLPYFHLVAREHGKPVMDIRVVVGTPDNSTPIFSSRMQTVVFSPYWNIPDSIVEGETVPAVARDPGYLSRNGIDILRVSGSKTTRVEPSEVDWDDAEELKRLAFRQRPGARNALGHVKFLFPNPYSVYLHDTPADRLFSRPGRAFSHGCVRVEEPETLAQYVLHDQPDWTAARIAAAMRSGAESPVRLKTELPVHLTYFTAWVDENGGLHFQRDIYGYDLRQAELSLRAHSR